MGIIFENHISVYSLNDNTEQLFQYCLFHLMSNGIRCQFNDDLTLLEEELKRCGGGAKKIAISKPMYSLTPMHKFRDVITSSFEKKIWDHNKFQLFCQVASGIGINITTGIKELRDAYDTHINCKRFVQIFCFHFNLKIPVEYQKILEDEVEIFKSSNKLENLR